CAPHRPLNPDDPSLHVRLNTQAALREYMSSRPFGGGLGVIGANGMQYNSDRYLSTVQPDSYFVKIWAMYGIVGLIIWLGIMLYIFGKCCGIVWNLPDGGLKIKMIALTAGFAGILFCSYGNEVINTMPSSIVVYLSWVFVFISPQLAKQEKSLLLS
ncbi:MAG: O-antigen ligase domain-containing protein, partial [Sphingobacteriales bacterium]